MPHDKLYLDTALSVPELLSSHRDRHEAQDTILPSPTWTGLLFPMRISSSAENTISRYVHQESCKVLVALLSSKEQNTGCYRNTGSVKPRSHGGGG